VIVVDVYKVSVVAHGCNMFAWAAAMIIGEAGGIWAFHTERLADPPPSPTSAW